MVEFALSQNLDLHAVQLDLLVEPSIDEALDLVIREAGCLDALIHELGPKTRAPGGAGDTNDSSRYLSSRSMPLMGRAVLPLMRRQCRGLVTWIASASPAGSTPCASAEIASLTDVEAVQLANAGIDCCTVYPRTSEDRRGEPGVADPDYIANLIVELVSLPHGARPQRIFVQSTRSERPRNFARPSSLRTLRSGFVGRRSFSETSGSAPIDRTQSHTNF